MKARSWLAAGFGLAGLTTSAACDPPPAVVVAKSAAAPSSSSTEPAFVDPGVFHSKRFGMHLSLPRSADWKIDDHRSRWLFASQPKEEGSLAIRLFSDENRMNRDKCETIRALSP